MTALVVLVVYLVAGCFSAILVVLRPAPMAPLGKGTTAALTIVLWPFVLPLAVMSESPVRLDGPAHKSERAHRLDAVACRLEEGWARVGGAAQATEGRERFVLEGFLARLRGNDHRLVEMEEAIKAAPASVKERLERLRDVTGGEIDRGTSLLEELAAQLTLLRFADMGDPSIARAERDHIEDLLARIEALAEASPSPALGRAADAPA